MAIADVSAKPIAELVSLAGRVAVVTGGAQGLGHAMVNRLAEAGAAVLIIDLRAEQAAAAAAQVASATGSRVMSAAIDVTDEAAVSAVADLAVAELGSLDIWVNNAGLYPNVPLLNVTIEDWDKVMTVNLRGVFIGAREAARRMIDAGQGGVIVNVVSTAGFRGVAPGVTSYVTSKHGVRGMIKQMALELAPHDIRVLGVAPTFCTTEGNMAALAELPDRVREEIAATLSSRLGRVGVPDDIARAVLFAASDMSLFMTGSTLLVDAGETI
ncbi:MAG: SDR family oxidoreductase [Sphingomonadales bacterium]|nr:SDR family oxidoreductase [Sphingomonadales bacterium]